LSPRTTNCTTERKNIVYCVTCTFLFNRL